VLGADSLSAIKDVGTSLIRDERRRPLTASLRFHPVVDRDLKRAFDASCQALHYAGSCRRVGRRLRLAVMFEHEWVGGVVLGSPFPNIRPRDDAFGISRFTRDLVERGLDNAWGRENIEYWQALQLVVNQARAFVFPQHAGQGLGIAMHRLLETHGRSLWESTYGPMIGFDTLCADPASRLFKDNGWALVGRTKGYSRDPTRLLSRRVRDGVIEGVRDNAGLVRARGSPRWWVWVKILEHLDQGRIGEPLPPLR
jgi:hypothetical protein